MTRLERFIWWLILGGNVLIAILSALIAWESADRHAIMITLDKWFIVGLIAWVLFLDKKVGNS